MVFYETDRQEATPHRVRQERLLEKGRGLLNLCDCKVQGAYDVGLFVTYPYVSSGHHAEGLLGLAGPQASLAYLMDMPGW